MATGTAPKVSVVITCFNLGRYLAEAVDSVLGQTFEDFEVLVVDDGSTDPDTLQLLGDYDRPRTRVIRCENRGLPGARNVGIRAARGTYVCALDADDLLEPTWLEKSVRLLDADPSLTFVSHWLRAFGDEEWDWTPDRCDFPALLDVNTVNGAALVKRQVLLDVGLLDESMREGCEDWDLWITLVERGYRGTILPEFLFRYRRRADSMSRRMNTGSATHPRLYHYIVDKHADSYRLHLPGLHLRRARIIHEHQIHIRSLRLEQARLEQELAAKRERLEGMRAKSERLGGHEGAGQDRARLTARLEEHRAAADYEQQRAGQLETERDEARHHVRVLRSSISWRLTAPLRVVHAWLLRLRRGR